MTEQQPEHRVLVVDDEESILQSIRRVLRRARYGVDVAASGAEAVQLLKSADYAVIICDQRMPEMNGAAVLAQAYELRPDTYRVTLTGYTDLASAQQSINEGHVQQFLTKPWNDEHLLGVIATGVKSHDLIQENRRLTELAEQHRRELDVWSGVLEQRVAERTAVFEEQTRRLERLRDRLQNSLHDTVEVIVGILDVADANVAAHSRRVGKISTATATAMDLNEEITQEVEYVALLHDVGRVADLEAPGARKRVRAGGARRAPVSETGSALLARVRGFEAVADAVRAVPAHFDGSGKVDLRGEAIPLAARIVAAAKAFDEAVFSPSQPTKPLLADGYKLLDAGSGRRFDPAVVAALKDGAVSQQSVSEHEVELSPRRLQAGMVLSRDLANAQGTLLLSVGTELTSPVVMRLRELADAQMLARGVFVQCSSTDEDDEQGDQAPSAPRKSA